MQDGPLFREVDIGAVLKEFRMAELLSVSEEAQAVGVSQSLVSAWEGNRKRPSRDKLMLLARVWRAPWTLVLHEYGEPVQCEMTFGQWVDLRREQRRLERQECTLNSFTHRSGAARAKRKGTAGGEGQGGGLTAVYAGLTDHRARASA